MTDKTFASITLGEVFGNQPHLELTVCDADREDLHDMAGRLCLLCEEPVAKTWKVLLVGDQQLRCVRPVCATCAGRGREECMPEIVARLNKYLAFEFSLKSRLQ